MTEADAARTAFDKDGSVAQQIANIAKAHSVAILYGFMEACGDKRYNSVQLVKSDGQLLLHYRKTHLWGDLDRQLFTPGNTLAPVADLNGWSISTLICYDVEFPETVRALSLAGAELVLVPTALMQPWRFVAEQLVAVRAAESQVFIAYANLVGSERNTHYEGRSCIVGPDGEFLSSACASDNALLHVTLEKSSLRTTRQNLPYLHNRRPELYASLAQSGFSETTSNE